MKKINNIKYLILLFFIFGISTNHFAQQNIFNINGTIDTEYDGQYIMLFTFDGDNIRTVDTTTVENGKFHFHGNEYKDDFSLISIGNYPDKVLSLELVLDKGNIRANFVDSVYSSGTYLNDILPIFRKSRFVYHEKIIEIAEKNEQAGENKYQKDLDEAWQRLFDYEYEFKKENKDNIIGRKVYIEDIGLYTDPYFLNNLDMHFDELYNEVFKDIQTNPEVISNMEYRKRKIEQSGFIGKKYIDFEFFTIDGQKVSISDYVGKSKYLFIDLWASWCGPCIAEMPHLKKVHDEYKDKGLTIIGVSVNDREKSWKKALEKIDAPWPQFIASDEISKKIYEAYKITGIPFNLLLDETDTIILVKISGSVLGEILKQL